MLLARPLQVTRGRKLRMDGTVVATNIHHPTDSTLLYDGVRVLGRTLAKPARSCSRPLGWPATPVRDRTRSAKRQMKRIMDGSAAAGHRGGGPDAHGLSAAARLAQATVQQAQQVERSSPPRPPPRAQRLAAALDHLVPLVGQVIAQTTRRVLQGEAVPAGEKVVSLFEPHTAIIRKGKPGKPTEFGRVIWLDEVEGGIISRYAVLDGNPDEDAQLPPSLDHHRRVFQAPASPADG